MQLFDKFITEYAELVQAKGYGKEALIRYKICKNRVQEFLKKEMQADDIPVESIPHTQAPEGQDGKGVPNH